MNHNTTTTSYTNDWPKSLDECLEVIRKVKAEFDRTQQEALKSAAEVAEIECHICHRKIIVINGWDIVACEHIIESLRAALPPASPGCRPGLSAMKIFPLNDGPARFRDGRG